MKEEFSILLVDDDKTIHDGVSEFLSEKGYTIHHAYKPSSAFSVIKKHRVDIVLLDIQLPEMNGVQVLKKIKQDRPDLEVIMITGQSEVESIIEALENGAFDYFHKPVSFFELRASIERTSRFISLHNELEQVKNTYAALASDFREKVGFEVVGKSRKIKKVMELAMKAAKSPTTPVLISGASGTGKELVARSIHFMSDRQEQCFLPVNCTAIPESLIESEFFGHIKGAFTGAVSNKLGCFEAADKGTLFIDEIGDMPLKAQSKLLRVLEDKKVRKIGSNRYISTDTKIISATNKDLKEMVDKKQFRLDLYYRLNSFEIPLPSLQERKEDIPELVNYYTEYYAKNQKKKITRIDEDVVKVLQGYDFPGNIRELKNLVERAVILCDTGVLNLKFFPLSEITGNKQQSSARKTMNLEELEREKIIEALAISDSNISKAAALLGLTRASLYRKIRKLSIQ